MLSLAVTLSLRRTAGIFGWFASRLCRSGTGGLHGMAVGLLVAAIH